MWLRTVPKPITWQCRSDSQNVPHSLRPRNLGVRKHGPSRDQHSVPRVTATLAVCIRIFEFRVSDTLSIADLPFLKTLSPGLTPPKFLPRYAGAFINEKR